MTTRFGRLNNTGATVVEFAVIVALLLIILFGILEFGFIFMQEHYVANAAREGVRIGVRANNFNCFEGDSDDECTVDRQSVVDAAVRDYLSTLYSAGNIVTLDVSRVPNQNNAPEDNKKTLTVTVEARNFFPPILSSLVKLIPGTDFELPETITYTTTGDYEDPSEP